MSHSTSAPITCTFKWYQTPHNHCSSTVCVCVYVYACVWCMPTAVHIIIHAQWWDSTLSTHLQGSPCIWCPAAMLVDYSSSCFCADEEYKTSNHWPDKLSHSTAHVNLPHELEAVCEPNPSSSVLTTDNLSHTSELAPSKSPMKIPEPLFSPASDSLLG